MTTPERGRSGASAPVRRDAQNDTDWLPDAEAHLPQDHWPLPELDEVSPHRHEPTPEEFAAVAKSPEFAELKRRFRNFAFPMTALFLIWYFAYVLLSVYAKGFMSTPVFGRVNLGMLLGLLQFATTFLITWLYIRHANKNLDPIATKLKADLERGTR